MSMQRGFIFIEFPLSRNYNNITFSLETLATFVYLHNSLFYFLNNEHVKFSWKICYFLTQWRDNLKNFIIFLTYLDIKT